MKFFFFCFFFKELKIILPRKILCEFDLHYEDPKLWSLLTVLVHLTCSSSGTAQEDLAPVVSQLFDVPAIPGEEPSEGKTWPSFFTSN